MKTHYVAPGVKVSEVSAYSIMLGVSGGNTGLQEGGQDPGNGSVKPQAPRRPF